MSGVDRFADAARVADTVLYEGYVLYPYRASSRKNQTRWQFGVLMPPGYVDADPSERTTSRTEVVLEAKSDAVLHVRARFLHVCHRSGGDQPDWDETAERHVDVEVPVAELRVAPLGRAFAFPASVETADGVRRESAAVSGVLDVAITELPGPYGALRLTVEVANRTPGTPADRDGALRGALVAAHVLLALDSGRFLSMTDRPEWAAP